MQSHPRYTIGQLMFAFSAALITALFLLALLVTIKMNDVRDQAALVGSTRAPQLLRVGELELNVTRASLQLRHAMLARTPAERDAALADVTEKAKFLQNKMDEFGKAMTTPAGKKAFEPMPELLNTFLALCFLEAGQKCFIERAAGGCSRLKLAELYFGLALDTGLAFQAVQACLQRTDPRLVAPCNDESSTALRGNDRGIGAIN